MYIQCRGDTEILVPKNNARRRMMRTKWRVSHLLYRRSAFRRRWTHFCILSLRGGLARNGLWVL
jgi:hypothetical protein